MGRLILRGGRVIDPSQGIDGGFDLTIEDGRIVGDRVCRRMPRRSRTTGSRTSRGLLVVPGLIDLHGHWYEGSPYGIDPLANLRGGVTTAVDAGTAGFANFGQFRRHTIEKRPFASWPTSTWRPAGWSRVTSASSRTSATRGPARPPR